MKLNTVNSVFMNATAGPEDKAEPNLPAIFLPAGMCHRTDKYFGNDQYFAMRKLTYPGKCGVRNIRFIVRITNLLMFY